MQRNLHLTYAGQSRMNQTEPAYISTRANVGILKQAEEAKPYPGTLITVWAQGHIYPKVYRNSVCTPLGLREADVEGLYKQRGPEILEISCAQCRNA